MAEVNFLRGVTLFVEFEPAEVDELRKSFQATRFAAGDAILQEGNANRALHIVQNGRVRVSRHSDGGPIPLTDLGPGDTFGELSIIEDGVATASLHAITETEILSISMNDLAGFLRTRPAAASKFWRQVAVELRRRLVQTNDIVRAYFELNREMAANPTLRQMYALCAR